MRKNIREKVLLRPEVKSLLDGLHLLYVVFSIRPFPSSPLPRRPSPPSYYLAAGHIRPLKVSLTTCNPRIFVYFVQKLVSASEFGSHFVGTYNFFLQMRDTLIDL